MNLYGGVQTVRPYIRIDEEQRTSVGWAREKASTGTLLLTRHQKLLLLPGAERWPASEISTTFPDLRDADISLEGAEPHVMVQWFFNFDALGVTSGGCLPQLPDALPPRRRQLNAMHRP